MTPLDEAEHAAASGDPAAALRDTRAAEVQWREYGFGPWAIRDLRDEGFLGGAELRFAGDGIEGIAPDEVEAGWWVTKERRNQGIGSEAMHAAIGDLWDRTDAANHFRKCCERGRQRARSPAFAAGPEGPPGAGTLKWASVRE